MNFSKALDLLKEGKAVKREMWNQPNMCVFLEKGSFDRASYSADMPQERWIAQIDSISVDLFNDGDTGSSVRLPNLAIKNAQGATLPWNPSHHCLLAEDWAEVTN